MQIEKYQQIYSAMDFIRDKWLFEEFAIAKLLFEEEKKKRRKKQIMDWRKENYKKTKK